MSFKLASLICSGILLNAKSVLSSGRSKFECPDGHYLNRISSVYADGQRMYTYSCKPLSPDVRMINETCGSSAFAANSLNDMFLACNSSQQYVVGVSIVDYEKYQTWNLLCCESKEVKIELIRCSTTSLINDLNKNFTFNTSIDNVIIKLESIYDIEKRDRQWWIKQCSLKVTPNRVDVANGLVPNYQGATIGSRAAHSFESDNKIVRRMDITSVEEHKSRSAGNVGQQLKLKDSALNAEGRSKIFFASSKPTTELSSKTVESDLYADYYNPDVKKFSPEAKAVEETAAPDTTWNSIFKNLHKIFKALQDGLLFLQLEFGSTNVGSEKGTKKVEKSSGSWFH